jgi:hypothetical protein
MVREVLVKFLFAFCLAFFFGNSGIMFLIGYVVGVEFMQMCYRSFRDGYRWDDLYKKPFILVRYLKIKDTVLDLLSYVIGVLVARFIL